MSFDERQLRAFLALVDAGSIGRAAARMNMSQPSLSRQLRALEDQHGVALFQRLSTGVALSDAGEALLPHARMLLFEMEQAAETLRAVRGLRRGVVRIGAVSAVVRPIVAPTIARLRASAPELRVQVLDALDNRLVAALSGNAIDLMIAGKLDVSDEVLAIGECRYDDRYHPFCRAANPLAHRPGIAAADVLPGAWAMPPPGETPRVLFDELVRQNGFARPNVVVEASAPSVIAAAVIEADLLGWLPGPLIANDVANDMVARLDIAELQPRRRFFVYRRARGLLPVAARRFFDLLPLREPDPAA